MQVVNCIIMCWWVLIFWIIKQVTVTHGQSVLNFKHYFVHFSLQFSSLLFVLVTVHPLNAKAGASQDIVLTCYWLSFNRLWHGLFREFCNRIRNKGEEDQCFYNTAEVCHKCSLQLNGKVEVKLDFLQSERESLDVQHDTIYHIYGCCP